MAFQSVPDTCLFIARFADAAGRVLSFGLYSRNTAAPWDATQMGLIGADLRTAVVNDYLPFVSNELDFIGWTARDLEPEFGRFIETPESPVIAGGLASPALPNNVSVVGSFIGEPGAAPSRGRIFLLPPAESQVEGSIVNAGALASLQTALESLHNAMSAAGPAHVIVSRYSGSDLVPYPDGTTRKKPTKRAVAVTNTVPTVIVRNRVDSQRARLAREG